MHYLTVQDVLWIHLQIAKKAVKFNYAKLEEAVNYQYAYGKSKDVLSQASRFLVGFPAMSPFECGNRAAALASAVTFLELNGYQVSVGEGQLASWFERASTRGESMLALDTGVRRSDHAHHTTTRQVANEVLKTYSEAFEKLLD